MNKNNTATAETLASQRRLACELMGGAQKKRACSDGASSFIFRGILYQIKPPQQQPEPQRDVR